MVDQVTIESRCTTTQSPGRIVSNALSIFGTRIFSWGLAARFRYENDYSQVELRQVLLKPQTLTGKVVC